MLRINDYSDIRELSQRLVDCVNRIDSLTKPVAMAKQLRDFSGDRAKRALAVATQAQLGLDGALSNAAAESRARSSESYSNEMAKLGMDLRDAEKVVADWEAAKCAWESVRSLIALQRTISDRLQG